MNDDKKPCQMSETALIFIIIITLTSLAFMSGARKRLDNLQ